MKILKLIAAVTLLIGANTFAQDGSVSGKVFQFVEGEEKIIPMAQIIYVGNGETKLLTKTDFDGNYNFTLAPGVHKVLFRSTGLRADTITFEIAAGVNTPYNHEMHSKEFDIVYVIGKVKPDGGTVVKAVEDTKNDDKVVVVQTGSQMEEKGSGDIGDATKKMTGLSTVGSVLYVRGLGDRYNVAYLNGLPIPSPNPDFRVVPLNIFPTDIVNSVQVSKVMSSELYGDFAGGAFNITTKSFYNDPTLKVSIGSGVNTQTTFKDFRTYEGGPMDYLGFDNGARAIPDYVINNSQQGAYQNVNNIYHPGFYQSVEGKTTGFSDNFGTSVKKAPVNSSFSITGGQFIPFTESKDKSKGFGFLGLLSHDNSYRYADGQIKIINAQSEDRLNYDFVKYQQNTSTTGLLNLYVRLNPNHNISANALFVNTSSDETRETWGFHFDYATGVYSRRLTFKQNWLNVNQIIGTHKFLIDEKDKNFARLTIDWRGSYSMTGSTEPDRRQFVALYDEGNINNTSTYTFNHIDKNENHRFYSGLRENEIAAKGNVRFVLVTDEIVNERSKKTEVHEKITLNAGADYKSKTRNFDYKQYNYVLNTMAGNTAGTVNIYDVNSYLNSEQHDLGQFYIDELIDYGSSYIASLDVMSFYGDVKFKMNKIEIIPGVRYESSTQIIENRNQQSPSLYEKSILLSDLNSGILPSLITKFSLTDNDIIRAVGSKTVTRPKFNEMAPFQYVLFFAGRKAVGNPNLQNGINYNADLRYEHYGKPGEMISIGGFYKYLDNPIEQTMKATASGQLVSYTNALSANVAGVEVEFIKSLDFLVKEDKRDSSFLRHFGIGINAAYMYTSVNIDTTDLGAINTNSTRPLEGASPFLINADLRFQKEVGEKKTKKTYLAAVSYNVFGRRLFAVGSNGIGDQYELPVSSLNFVAKMTMRDKFSIGIKARNLLNPTIRIVQEDMVDVGNDLDVSTYRRGIDFSISLGYSF